MRGEKLEKHSRKKHFFLEFNLKLGNEVILQKGKMNIVILSKTPSPVGLGQKRTVFTSNVHWYRSS